MAGGHFPGSSGSRSLPRYILPLPHLDLQPPTFVNRRSAAVVGSSIRPVSHGEDNLRLESCPIHGYRLPLSSSARDVPSQWPQLPSMSWWFLVKKELDHLRDKLQPLTQKNREK
ncbi:hypothetical protein U9M48_039387 [Paspalum notatum var. saurae]|uniref:Uncharacterized protein n=1 Tax=Paspalum notatum var. saurae TaxID=547442 RepID=A0AAQ3UNV7_PASNO